jgi:hypothetical protein
MTWWCVNVGMTWYVIGPMLEYMVHIYVHVKQKRCILEDGLTSNEILMVGLPLVYSWPSLMILWLPVLRYKMMNVIMNMQPELLEGLTAHREEHRRCNVSNFCVSAMWPDMMFSTWRRPYNGVNEYKVLEKMRILKPMESPQKLKTFSMFDSEETKKRKNDSGDGIGGSVRMVFEELPGEHG